jgi:hypothetical protein
MRWLLFLLFASSLFGYKSTQKDPSQVESSTSNLPPESPWFTGTLIVPQPTVIAYGSFLLENYLYFTTNTGSYNNHWSSTSSAHNFFSFNPQFFYYFGLTPWCDINIVPQFFYNSTNGQSSCHFGDLTIGLGFQILQPDYTPYFPGIKLAIREVFPTGKYQNLNANKLNTDVSGAGTFATQFNLILYQVYHLWKNHWLSFTASGQYQLNSATNIQGTSVYGKGAGTALPGNSFQGIVSFEFSLTQNWVLAIDNVYTHTDATQVYNGTVGGLPSSEQFSFAPAIEYNFNSSFGLIAGCWFSAFGRNSAEFRSGVVNIEYTY